MEGFSGNIYDDCEGEYVCCQLLFMSITICSALYTKLCKLCVHACVDVCVWVMK